MPPRRRIAALLALAASRAQVNDGWSCDGPLPSVHGQRSGDLVDGGFEVLLHRHPLHPREAHAEIMGSTVELELVGPAGLAGFLMAPSKGKVRPHAADDGTRETQCRPRGVTHARSRAEPYRLGARRGAVRSP